MVALIVEEIVATRYHIGYDAAVGQKTCREKHHTVLAKELGQLVLQLYVYVESAVEEGRTRTAGAVFVDGALGGLLQSGVVGEAKVAVGSEHQNRVVITGNIHLSVLLAADGSEIRINSSSFGFLRNRVLC